MRHFKENLMNDDDKVIDFQDAKLALAGGHPGDENWLEKLEVGTCFLARERNDKTEFLPEYHLLHKGQVSTTLMMVSPMGQKAYPHVDTLRFSRKNVLIEVLGVIKDDEVPFDEDEKEIDNGDVTPV